MEIKYYPNSKSRDKYGTRESPIVCQPVTILPGLLEQINKVELFNQKCDIILNTLIKITDCFGGYIGIPIFENRNIMGIKISSLQNISSKVGEVGSIIEYQTENLSFQALKDCCGIISNNKKYLKIHHQLGENSTKNILCIPIGNYYDSTKPHGILVLYNQSKFFHHNIIPDLNPIFEILKMQISYQEIINKTQKEKQLYLIENHDEIKDMTSFIIRNSKDIAVIFKSDGTVLVQSKSLIGELRLISNIEKINYLEDLKNDDNMIIVYNMVKKMLNRSKRDSMIDDEHKVQKFITPVGTIYLDSTFGTIFDQINDDPICAFWLAKNVTKTSILQNKLTQTNHQLEQALKEKDLYMSRISHELRTPLNSIYGFSQLIELSLDSPDQIDTEWITRIIKSSKILLKLIDEVLDISCINGDNIRLSMESVNITQVIKEVVQMLHPSMEKMNLTVKLDINKDGFIVLADHHRLTQVITNIISNATKYNKKNGKIDIQYQVEENKLLIKKINHVYFTSPYCLNAVTSGRSASGTI